MTNKIFFRTLKFCWLKLGLGLICTLIDVIIASILLLIGFSIGDIAIPISIILTFIAINGVTYFAKLYFGYMIDVGHVAIVAKSVQDGIIPDNQVALATQMVKEKFVSANAYFVVDKLIKHTVQQIQKTVGHVGGMLSNVPGMSGIVSVIQLFVSMALNYVDECCIAYTFLSNDKPFKSACDGIVLYYQNWKPLLKNALKLTIFVTLFNWLFTAMVLLTILFSSGFSKVGFILVIAIVLLLNTFKKAFVDSYIMVNMVTKYTQVGQNTEITHDLYTKLCNLSSKFKELFNKSQVE